MTDIYYVVSLESTDKDLLASAMEVESQGEYCAFNFMCWKMYPHSALTCAQLIICDRK